MSFAFQGAINDRSDRHNPEQQDIDQYFQDILAYIERHPFLPNLDIMNALYHLKISTGGING